jgi:alkylation response protein AidB-like acyl-CoA dehydrogenase
MDLTPSAEQLEIIESSRSFLRNRLPITRIRALLETEEKVDPAIWCEAADLGWFTIGLPEEFGGVGFGLADEALLLREIGRSLAPGPFVSTLLAARVAAFAGNTDIYAEIVSGRQRVGLVIAGASGDVAQLVDADQNWALVISDSQASIIDISNLPDIRSVTCVDPTTTLRRATIDAAPVLACVSAVVDPIQRRARVLVAAMLTGIAEAVRDLAANHATNRFQFDKPIGVNQAVKHPCANMAVRAELSYAQMVFAAVAADEGRSDADFHALSAFLVAVQAAIIGGDATVQVMGGMGFTFEHDTHLYVKRTMVLSRLLDGVSVSYEKMLAMDPAN